LEVDQSKYLNWNENEKEKDQTEDGCHNENGNVSPPSHNYELRTRVRRLMPQNNTRKRVRSQLFRLIAKMRQISTFEKIEKSSHEDHIDFGSPELIKIANINIPTIDKETMTSIHREKIKNLDTNDIIIYTDGSKSENDNTGASIYDLKRDYHEKWNLGSECENSDAELFAIHKAIEYAEQRLQQDSQRNSPKIWVFSDSQAMLKRLRKNNNLPGQHTVSKIYRLCMDIKNQHPYTEITFEWVPAHMETLGNEKADFFAKMATEEEMSEHTFTSFSYIKRSSKAISLRHWQNIWQKSNQGKSYKKLGCMPKWEANRTIAEKRIWSTYIQLKMGHGYFNSYLINIPNSGTREKQCFCHRFSIQNPTHLILECKEYATERKEMFEKLTNCQKTFSFLFNTEIGRERLFQYIRKTNIATREWHLNRERD
jgi:ribonuclease HI